VLAHQLPTIIVFYRICWIKEKKRGGGLHPPQCLLHQACTRHHLQSGMNLTNWFLGVHDWRLGRSCGFSSCLQDQFMALKLINFWQPMVVFWPMLFTIIGCQFERSLMFLCASKVWIMETSFWGFSHLSHWYVLWVMNVFIHNLVYASALSD
jgi:hypothetical protein